MKEDTVVFVSEAGPDLLVSPHILPLLMELFAGDWQQALSQQEQVLVHLATCCYCRTTAITLLGHCLEYNCRNNDSEEPARNLLTRLANIHRLIESREAQEYERLGVYAEVVVNGGWDKAAMRFPDIAAHLKACPHCRSALEATAASIAEPDEID